MIRFIFSLPLRIFNRSTTDGGSVGGSDGYVW
jgi:hypothetical protein